MKWLIFHLRCCEGTGRILLDELRDHIGKMLQYDYCVFEYERHLISVWDSNYRNISHMNCTLYYK
uniref:Uncharacterized protein n=1 Tax=Octopus bimaculoides TaxID=37653 RepID=A0A0L8I888_OCTBM